ncbi:histidinol-phosphate transaminase [Parabacteroides sp. 52]|uniref:histidinol-phosphate transaminase n=1 Tax=unclassified Parabacteroides TaxID=2649774 RepID=UPI0013D149B1|nr:MULTISPECIES: histidinol-phosphate transaminase [unclassified Parabacteroides]MDH6535672.1 histidinol-phosphate aminotransferase [Parabacteroides sp. PM5-20]NDV56265.1 histidinol-phosphate transaminase [Parabacteroides sp. 52]
MKNIKDIVRPNVWKMKPYSSARNEFHGEASVFLDANENPWNAPYNRYPDPLQKRLKERISELKDISPDCIFVGNGSDEPIDLILRVFCEPGVDNIASITPSYGMYEVSADLNNIACIKVPLDEGFQLNADTLLHAVNEKTKVLFLCSPNNPSGNLLDKTEIDKVLESFPGIVVVDEAYIDFASSTNSFLAELYIHPNLVVLQTLSKAWGAAGIRLGMAFASKEIIDILNKVKYPYNVNQLTQEYALQILNNVDTMQEQLKCILAERDRLERILSQPPFSYKVYPSDANFILVEVGEANAIYKDLVEKGVVVRNRNNITLCSGCLRITIGKPEENDILLQTLKNRIV